MSLPTTLLLHRTPHDQHYDWLIVPPHTLDQPDAPLWAVRATHPWHDWRALRRLTLTPLPPHRRRYLTWEGPLSGNRGHVTHLDHGHVVAHRWTPRHLQLTLTASALTLRIDLPTPADAPQWFATVSS